MVDKKDIQIIDALKEDARLSTQKISKKTGIPITTVHHRIKKLVNDKVIKRFTVDINPEALGKTMLAYILVSVDNVYCKKADVTHTDLANIVKKNELVEDAATITGESDLIVKVRVKGIKELDKFMIDYLRPLRGILKTDTKIVLEEA